MAYGWDERCEYEKLRRRYPAPPTVYGYSGGYPADYLRFLESVFTRGKGCDRIETWKKR